MCIPAFIGASTGPGLFVARVSLAGVIAVNEIPYMVHSLSPHFHQISRGRLLDIEQGAQSWFITGVLVFIMIFIHCLDLWLLCSSFFSEALHRQQEHGEAERGQQAGEPREEGHRR